MSYILDALRKSDQLRQRGAAPTLLLGQATATAPKQPALLAYGLLALFLLGVGIAIGWLRPWQSEPAAPAPAAVAANPPKPGQSKLPAVPPEMAPKPEPELHAQNSASATQAVPAPARAPALAQPHGTAGVKIERQRPPPKAVAKASKKAAAPVPDRAMSTSGAAAGAAPVPAVIAMAELPLAIQQELPPMSISVHAYSGKAAERLVDINNRLLHEGEDVAPGLRLEQI
ncbi:MAG: general secretion pathway protein GspB, partial [Giesbergeria sp.]